MCKNLIKSVLSALLLMFVLTGSNLKAQDKLIGILDEELNREMKTLKTQDNPPYYMHYRVDEVYSIRIDANLGVLTGNSEENNRKLAVMIRIGNNEMDNYREIRDTWEGWSGYDVTLLPLDNDPDAIKEILWKTTDETFRKATDKYAKVKANVAVKVAAEDKGADFSKEVPNVYYDPPIIANDMKFDVKQWEAKVKKYSEQFLAEPKIFDGSASIEFKILRKYLVTSEGTKIVQNLLYSRLFIDATIKADDGMELPLYKSYFAYKPENLPDDNTVINDAKDLVKKLQELRVAPVVEPYSGPALMSGEASGVFFHEIFGHRIEGERQKSEYSGQTFKKKVGTEVLPKNMSVIMDPTIQKYAGQDLNGYYKYDDEGIKGQRVNVVVNGVLKDFIMSRTAIDNFPKSNGHSRGQINRKPEARQSNLIVETKDPQTMEQLRKSLREEAKKQGKEYAYFFKNVTGGFTNTGRYNANSFNVMPTEVYRVFVDGRADELVRGVDLIGTPLAMFSHIDAAGDKPGVFTGMCGASSGWVPVTAISPALFVSQIEMQKKYKAQDKPIILPRPDTDK